MGKRAKFATPEQMALYHLNAGQFAKAALITEQRIETCNDVQELKRLHEIAIEAHEGIHHRIIRALTLGDQN